MDDRPAEYARENEQMTIVERLIRAAEVMNHANVERAQQNALPNIFYREVMEPHERALDEAFQAYYEASNDNRSVPHAGGMRATEDR